jgi:hypothetical protein
MSSPLYNQHFFIIIVRETTKKKWRAREGEGRFSSDEHITKEWANYGQLICYYGLFFRMLK